MGESDFNQIMQMRKQPVIAAENLGGEQKLPPIQIPAMSKDIDEQLKLAHGVVDVLERPNRKICVTMLRYNVDKPESLYAQVRLVAGKEEEKI